MEPSTQKLIHTFGALADLGQEIAGTGDFNEMVRTSMHLLLGTLALRRGAVVECSGPGPLRCVSIWGLGDQLLNGVDINEAEMKAFLASQVPDSLVSNTSSTNPFLGRYREKLAAEGIELVLPMIVRGEVTGLVLLGGKASGEEFSNDDFETIHAMVRHIGVGIHTHRLLEQVAQRAEENRRLYEELRAIYRDTVRAFAAAIDIKDKYTQGHSERVGRYSEIIARELGWSEQEVEGIQIAGYLHDIGKLIVDRDIINAPYRIDAKSSSDLNKHPAAGYEILSPIRHPYADIPLMAKYHHERLDGRGYPDGLTDEQIPLGAKIVSLADSFDAMTTDRPYRRRRSFEDVVRDLRESSGKQFDGKVVAAFARAILKEVTGETKERRITKMLGKGYLEGEHTAALLTDLIEELGKEVSRKDAKDAKAQTIS
ncbi:MAG TPA: HD domain-containing phosphohydrolase [Pyrinomonadaceae bacterium]|jgi:HD-GYP domain-containing protein (c-di-GMP phosphodiesterase class II)|nr:HD domain-containing phosphohydrolase [Pyrinomonadaceae bacterium]